MKEIDTAVSGMLSNKLKEHSLRSKAGYLKINLIEMTKSAFLQGEVYLKGDYPLPFSFSKDSATLLSIPGIKSAKFISRQEAMKKYVKAEGNENWSEILDENPLPNSIEIELENKDWTKESLEQLEAIIMERIPIASEFSYSLPLLEEATRKRYYFFEYKRM